MTDELINQDIHWIETDAQLEQCCNNWSGLPLLALDTEFVRTTTYYPIAGLIQINDGLATYLIDPLKIDDWYPLVELLENPELTIAMHSCSEDLEVLQIELGTVPVNILDTQVAIAFLGGESSMGYAKLVELELELEIPKSETRSDWLQRPLSRPQIHYAALDVEYLFQLAKKLEQKLIDCGRLTWVQEEGHRLYKNFKRLQDVNNSYTRVKSAWKLSPRKLSVLVALAKWRENYAQQHDVPRNRVVKERTLFEIALNCPKHVAKLRAIEGIPDRVIRDQGATIVANVIEQLNKDESELPEALPGPLSKSDQEQYKKLKSEVNEIADGLGIAVEHVLRKKDIEALYRMKLNENWPAISEYFSGWRKSAISDQVTSILKAI